MPLNEREQQILEEIERQFREDPEFVRKASSLSDLDHGNLRPSGRGSRLGTGAAQYVLARQGGDLVGLGGLRSAGTVDKRAGSEETRLARRLGVLLAGFLVEREELPLAVPTLTDHPHYSKSL